MASYTTTSSFSPASTTNTNLYGGSSFSPAPAAARPVVSQPVFQSQFGADNFGINRPSFNTLQAQAAAAPQSLGDALLNKPLDVFGGALLTGSQQMGNRPDANQVMSQVLVQLLSTVLNLVVGMLKGQGGGQPQLAQGQPAVGQGLPGLQQAGGLPSFPQLGGGAFPVGAPIFGGQQQPAVGQDPQAAQGGAPVGDIPVGFAPTGNLPIPTDRSEFESYLAAATDANGAQNGGIDQKRAKAGSKFASVADGEQFDAAIARNYAYQFAAVAKGYGGRTADGLADGANAFYRMSPGAQTFMQVAAVYKGDLAGGAKNYNNAKLKELLKEKGYDGADKDGVGATDIETIGAVADAIDRGVITLQDVLGKDGAIESPAEYQQAIDLVQSGKFADLVTKYEATPFGGGNGGGNGNAGNAGDAKGNAGAAGDARGNAGNAGDAQGNAGTAGDAKGNAGTAGDAKGNAGNAGDAKGNAGNAGDAKGNAGNAGGAQGNAGNAGGAGQAQAAAGATLGGVDGFYRDVLGTLGQGGGAISTGFNYGSLSADQRTQVSGLDDRHRAILHLWGIQMGSAGQQDGGVLLNVLQHPEQFKPAEVEVAKELAASDRANYGGITGKSLDQAFFGVYRDLTGVDISNRYGNAPIHYAKGPVNTQNRITGANGLSNFENEVMQLWGHSPLFTGSVDGSILDYSLNSANRLEVNLNNGDLQALKQADLASDGVVNGDSLNNSMLDVLDHVYMGGPSASMGRTMNEALAEASDRRAGLLPPPRQPAAQSINPIGLNQARASGYCPFLQGGGIQQVNQQQEQRQAQSSASANAYRGSPAPSPSPVSYTPPATTTPPVTSKPSPATISY